MNQAYLYFRTQATIGSDSDPAQSCLFPLSSLAGLQAASSSGVNTVFFYFKSMRNFDVNDQPDGTNTKSDSVSINLKSTTTVSEFISEFTDQVNSARSKQKKFLVVGDDDSRDPQYCSAMIDNVRTISIAASHS